MKRNMKSPCKECPFVGRTPGWLGSYSSMEELFALTRAEVFLPCHVEVDWESKKVQAEIDAGKYEQCIGQLLAMRGMCKRPRDRDACDHMDRLSKTQTVPSEKDICALHARAKAALEHPKGRKAKK